MADAISVSVNGVTETLRELDKLVGDLQTLDDARRAIGSELTSLASALAPKLTGALASTVTHTLSERGVALKAGSPAVVYAGVQEYGWPEKNIPEQSYLRKAVSQREKFIIEKYEDNIKSQIQKHNFN